MSRKLNHFLRSMEVSTDEFASAAARERECLRKSEECYQNLRQNVRLSIERPPEVKDRAIKTSTARRRPKTATTQITEDKEPTEICVEPAPFPIKRYSLPTRQIVGPQRYYGKKEESDDDFYRPQVQEAKFDMRITTMHSTREEKNRGTKRSVW